MSYFQVITTRWCSSDNQSARSSVPMISRWLWPGNRTCLEVASMVITWWIVFFVQCMNPYCLVWEWGGVWILKAVRISCGTITCTLIHKCFLARRSRKYEEGVGGRVNKLDVLSTPSTSANHIWDEMYEIIILSQWLLCCCLYLSTCLSFCQTEKLLNICPCISTWKKTGSSQSGKKKHKIIWNNDEINPLRRDNPPTRGIAGS